MLRALWLLANISYLLKQLKSRNNQNLSHYLFPFFSHPILGRKHWGSASIAGTKSSENGGRGHSTRHTRHVDLITISGTIPKVAAWWSCRVQWVSFSLGKLSRNCYCVASNISLDFIELRTLEEKSLAIEPRAGCSKLLSLWWFGVTLSNRPLLTPRPLFNNSCSLVILLLLLLSSFWFYMLVRMVMVMEV